MKLDRRVPIRATLAGLGVIAYGTTVLVVAFAHLPQDTVSSIFDALNVLTAFLGVAIGSDTWRPSGQAVSAPGAAQTLAAQARRGAATDTPPPAAVEQQPVPAAPRP